MSFWTLFIPLSMYTLMTMLHNPPFPRVSSTCFIQKRGYLSGRADPEHNKELAYQLMQEYERNMGLAFDHKITRASTSIFLSLFTANTKIWNDLYVNPYPCAPDEYVAIAYKYLPWGIKTTIRFDSLPKMPPEKKYYPISGDGHEYLMHIGVIKTMFNGLDTNNDPVGYPNGREVNLEFIIYINAEKQLALISDIRPQSN